jgi:hypothetical protein
LILKITSLRRSPACAASLSGGTRTTKTPPVRPDPSLTSPGVVTFDLCTSQHRLADRAFHWRGHSGRCRAVEFKAHHAKLVHREFKISSSRRFFHDAVLSATGLTNMASPMAVFIATLCS